MSDLGYTSRQVPGSCLVGGDSPGFGVVMSLRVQFCECGVRRMVVFQGLGRGPRQLVPFLPAQYYAVVRMCGPLPRSGVEGPLAGRANLVVRTTGRRRLVGWCGCNFPGLWGAPACLDSGTPAVVHWGKSHREEPGGIEKGWGLLGGSTVGGD